MFDPDDFSWTATSIDAANARAEIDFFISGKFYRDPNNVEEDPILLPELGTLRGYAHYVSARDALADPQPLVSYYNRILELAAHHSQGYDEINNHFWLSLRLVSDSGEIGFSWYDHMSEIEGVFDWLTSAQDGEAWHDVEQGWEVLGVRCGPKIHLREGGFDQGGENANLVFSMADLSKSVVETRALMSALLPQLVQGVGEDYWSRFRHDLSKC